MIRRTLQGITWDIPTPSHYELVLPDQKADRVCVAYLGDAWYLFHRDPTGNVGTRRFDSRDDAVAMVAQAFQNAGAL